MYPGVQVRREPPSRARTKVDLTYLARTGGACQDDYAFHSATQTCEACPESSADAWKQYGAYVISATVGLFALSCLYAYRKTLTKFLPERLRNALINMCDLGTVKIFVTTYQLTAAMPWTLDVEFPEPFAAFLSLISIFNLNLFGTVSLDCVGLPIPSYVFYVLITSIVPVVVVALIWANHAFRLRRVPVDASQRDTAHHGPMYWSLLITFLVAPSVMQTQLRGLNCFELESSGRLYLRVDTTIECTVSDPDYRLLLAVDIPLITLYQAIPLLYFFVLFRKRDRLNPTLYGRDFKELPPAEEQQLKYSKRDKDPVLADLKVRVFVCLYAVLTCSGFFIRPQLFFWQNKPMIFYTGVLTLSSLTLHPNSSCSRSTSARTGLLKWLRCIAASFC